MNKRFFKINQFVTVLVSISVFMFSVPSISNAQVQAIPLNEQGYVQAVAVPDGQADAYNSDTSNATGASGSASGAVSDALGCSASGLLGQAVSMGLKSMVGSAATGALSSVTSDAVPITSNSSMDNLANIKSSSDANASVNAIQQIFGVSFGASFNGIAFCIVNGLITYIANSTIAWANSGFQGNPAFLENPENFFQTLADRTASGFISNLAYNTTGINVCEPFRVDLAIALSESYAGGQGTAGQNRLSCSMDQMGSNFQNFANGGGIGGGNVQGYWSNWNQLRQDENNPAGNYLKAGEYLRAQIAVKENTAKFELGLNNGFLNFKKCEDPVAAKKGDLSSCKSTTPGSIIQSSLQDTLNLGKQRLVSADKIDQVITALANALIKKALNKVLEQN
ncbi:MAG: hypothetical protein KBB54_01015 [Candidatus Pacebacteria bacterium]|nr:hypothetical protein [Candidatus Paceibacterota bacterium]MBP9818395.1 hypothetical protein [Candidatus Paceibacterota bacterium]